MATQQVSMSLVIRYVNIPIVYVTPINVRSLKITRPQEAYSLSRSKHLHCTVPGGGRGGTPVLARGYPSPGWGGYPNPTGSTPVMAGGYPCPGK